MFFRLIKKLVAFSSNIKSIISIISIKSLINLTIITILKIIIILISLISIRIIIEYNNFEYVNNISFICIKANDPEFFKNTLQTNKMHNSKYLKDTMLQDRMLFAQWFSGIIDANGKFIVEFRGELVYFQIYIEDNVSNLRLLTFIKNNLGKGSISLKNKWTFRYKLSTYKTQYYKSEIIPLFESSPLRTGKSVSLEKFKEMIRIYEDNNINKNEKLSILKSLNVHLRNVNINILNNIPLTEAWFIGYCETRSIFEVKTIQSQLLPTFILKSPNNLSILVKIKDTFLLEGFIYSRGSWHYLEIKNLKKVDSIVLLLKNKFVGMISVDYRKWAKTIESVKKLIQEGLNVSNMEYINEKVCKKPNKIIQLSDNPILSSNVNFIQWFIGFIEGDGSIESGKNSNFRFILNIAQSTYNMRLIKFIYYKLNCVGTLYLNNNPFNEKCVINYRIRSSYSLKKDIIPLIDTYGLQSSKKYYSYMIFKKALFSQNDVEKLNLKFLLENQSLKATFDLQSDKLPTISWIIGFVEAEGSFFIVKHNKYYAFNFYIAQKENPILFKIQKVLQCESSIVYHKSTDTHELKVHNLESIKYLINFFDNRLIGMKAVEFRIWRYAFLNYRLDYEKLKHTQAYMRYLKVHYKLKNCIAFKNFLLK